MNTLLQQQCVTKQALNHVTHYPRLSLANMLTSAAGEEFVAWIDVSRAS
jgi:hypothetical protein